MRLSHSTFPGFVEAIPETVVERNYLDRFPAFLRKNGKRLVTFKSSILQNVVQRMKRTLSTNIVTAEKDIAQAIKAPIELLEIPEDFHFYTKPLRHQLLALRYLYTHEQAGLLLDPGLGKTKVVLDYIALMGFEKSFIVAPKALMFVWVEEVQKHRPDKTIYVLESTSWLEQIESAKKRLVKYEAALEGLTKEDDSYKRVRAAYLKAKRDVEYLPDAMAHDLAMAKSADIIVLNYDKASNGVDYLIERFKFDFIALDEALIKTHNSKRTEAMLKLGSKIPYRVIMSGTLINNSTLDAFAPIRFLNPSLVGTAYGRFEYYYAAFAETRTGQRFVVGVGKASSEEIRTILESCCIVMHKEDWLELPEKKFFPITCVMSDYQRFVLEDLKSNFITKVEDYTIEVANQLSMMVKLSQISNGFLYAYPTKVQSEEDYLLELFGEEPSEASGSVPEVQSRSTYYFHDQPKLDALESLIRGTLSGRKAIIWYNCSAEVELITKRLTEMGKTFLVIRGGTKNIGGIVGRFNNDPSYQFLVCQAKSVNYGITVLGAEKLDVEGVEVFLDVDTKVYTHIFYSLNYSLEVYLQQQDRSHRIGQTHEVEYYILLSDSPADRAIYDALQAKLTIREDMLVDYSRLI